MFSKRHKSENSKRPVISFVNCHMTRMSQYVNYHLQPHVTVFQSYVKYSTDFMKKISNLGKIAFQLQEMFVHQMPTFHTKKHKSSWSDNKR